MIKALKKYSVFTSYFALPFRKVTAKSTFKLLGVVLKDFFFLQFAVKWRIKKIPVVSVDHPLDKKVPFTPDRVGIYFDFINIWIRPMSMMIKKFGAKKGLPLCKEWLDRLRKTYEEAAKFYRFCLSTTDRPHYKKSLNFLKIHLFDPHYCCVPSLHIAIVVLVFTFYRDLFVREGFSAEEREAWTRELYEGAVSIGETVLYVKQHSVNCIPAALYMMICSANRLILRKMTRKLFILTYNICMNAFILRACTLKTGENLCNAGLFPTQQNKKHSFLSRNCAYHFTKELKLYICAYRVYITDL